MTQKRFIGIPDALSLPSIFLFLQIILLLLAIFLHPTEAWKNCQGGGVCPDYATCCPSATPGTPPACISARHGKDPVDATGVCCDETTGCPYGFSCGVRTSQTTSADESEDNPWIKDYQLKGASDTLLRTKTNEQDHHLYCKIDTEHPPKDLFHDQPRYQMCRIPDPSMTILHGFPISSANRKPSYLDNVHKLAYYSSHGDLLHSNIHDHEDEAEGKDSSSATQTSTKNIEKVLIMIHGSGRTAEDYFCVALSLVSEAERDTVLVIAPKFLAPGDLNSTDPFLLWQEDEDPPNYPMAHSWRYGADALNAPISSYAAIDRLVEYLVTAKRGPDGQPLFPYLKQISIAGHSAGGQVVHRWALLSKIPLQTPNVEIRVVAANPRSYCYLNGKRMIFDKAMNTTRWEYPSSEEINRCPDYNQWNWGLEQGGPLDLVVPYFGRRLAEISPPELSQEYARQRVVYLTGEYDVLEQKDHCATYELQGRNRHERALNYFAALQSYFLEELNHELHTVPESPHDHVLM